MGFLKVLGVFFVSMPLSVAVTFSLGGVWAWVEREYHVESVGHAMYAGWCFVATYGVIVFFGLLLLSFMHPKPQRHASR